MRKLRARKGSDKTAHCSEQPGVPSSRHPVRVGYIQGTVQPHAAATAGAGGALGLPGQGCTLVSSSAREILGAS